jgi:hypothetical protein
MRQYSFQLGRLEIILDLRPKTIGGSMLFAALFAFLPLTVFYMSTPIPELPQAAEPTPAPMASEVPPTSLPTATPTALPPLWDAARDADSDELILFTPAGAWQAAEMESEQAIVWESAERLA